jgi:hypothetical protein
VVDLFLWDALRNDVWPFIFSFLTSILNDIGSRLRGLFLLVNFFFGVQRMREGQGWGVENIVALIRDLWRTVGEC